MARSAHTSPRPTQQPAWARAPPSGLPRHLGQPQGATTRHASPRPHLVLAVVHHRLALHPLQAGAPHAQPAAGRQVGGAQQLCGGRECGKGAGVPNAATWVLGAPLQLDRRQRPRNCAAATWASCASAPQQATVPGRQHPAAGSAPQAAGAPSSRSRHHGSASFSAQCQLFTLRPACPRSDTCHLRVKRCPQSSSRHAGQEAGMAAACPLPARRRRRRTWRRPLPTWPAGTAARREILESLQISIEGRRGAASVAGGGRPHHVAAMRSLASPDDRVRNAPIGNARRRAISGLKLGRRPGRPPAAWRPEARRSAQCPACTLPRAGAAVAGLSGSQVSEG